MASLWLDREPIAADQALLERYDDVVVGAGLTGLVTGLLLARAGRSVVVIEARQIGAVTTGNTTGKLSLLQGTRLSRILERQSEAVARAYLEANREGQAWLLRFCEKHAVGLEQRPALTFAHDTDDSFRAARAEHDAALRLGLFVTWYDDLDVPFPHRGGTMLDDQYQLDAMELLAALTDELREHGGTVVTGRRVVKTSMSGPLNVTLEDDSVVAADNVVLCTGTPILDRGLYFAKVEPQRSYALAFDYAAPPRVMMLSAGVPTVSVRDATRAGRPLLLVGGEGHVVGRATSERDHLERLRAWTSEHYPGAVETHAWSAQDYASHDGLPFVGTLPRGRHHIFLATGYGKWGLTNGVAAALSIAAQVHGQKTSWATTISHRITRPSGALELIRLNGAVAAHLTAGLIRAEARPTPEPVDGEGRVGREGLVPVGRSRINNLEHKVVATCSHLGGVLRWNTAECTWDCPLHGSRFAPDGAVLEGPATRPLRQKD